jgi:hypothetical protein
MRFKELGTSGSFVKARGWKDWKNDDFVIGEFDNVDHTDKFGNLIYGIKVQESSFDAVKGSVVHINSGGNLKNLMNEVSLGDVIKVVYKGKVKIPKGKWTGTMTHDISVLLLEDDGKPATTSEDLI